MTPADKRRYLVVYDYGMGGLWGLLLARSEADISLRYPELTVVDARPAWMSPEDFARIERLDAYDIDDAPTGMLRTVVADRAAD
ncbi:hypothetical protein [Leifsonia sp. NPDC077715]|uniref:hypothetical protein n=1 Tax=Leifsonia sp. NPDC077715 TaxID=3155539 RepID=UPI00341B7C13